MKHLYRTLLIAAVLLVVSAFAFASEETVGVTINATAQIPTFIRFSLSAIGDVWSGIIGRSVCQSLVAPFGETVSDFRYFAALWTRTGNPLSRSKVEMSI